MLNPLMNHLRRPADVGEILDWLLRQGLMLTNTGLGNVQLTNWGRGYLEIKAQRGFGREFLRFFDRVKMQDGSACARAMEHSLPVVVPDVMADSGFRHSLAIMERAGVRAVQSTPIRSSSGAFLGVLSTHFPGRHQPTKIEMRNVQHAAQMAADALIYARINNLSAVDQISRSAKLIQQSLVMIERTDLLTNSCTAKW